MALAAGKRKYRLTLKTRTVASNSLNEPVETFTTLATVWASRMDVSDAERVRAQQVGAEITTRFQIPYSTVWADLNPKDRCVCQSREYEITNTKRCGSYDEGIEISATARADQNNLYS